MNNRDAILRSALALFNEKGTGPVSTNHIAAHAGVSPGNLYYHFPRKEAIVLELFRRMDKRWSNELNLPSDRTPTVRDLDALLELTFRLIGEFRFFYREPVPLVLADPELASLYRAQRQRGRWGFAELHRALSRAGVLPEADDAEIQRVADLCWMVTEFWLQNLELEGEGFESQGNRGPDLVLQLLGAKRT
jgi:AcrR family transcriptional regulator